jgi:hypothetical protein
LDFSVVSEVNAPLAVVVELLALPGPFPLFEPEVTEIEVPLIDIVPS